MSSLEGLIGDLCFAFGSEVSDSLTTWLGMKKDGIDTERNIELRNSMKYIGLTKTVINNGISNTVKFAIYGSLLYAVDCAVGIDDKFLNFHHSWLYGFGSLKYYVALNNLASSSNMKMMKKTSRILAVPLEMTLGRMSSYRKQN